MLKGEREGGREGGTDGRRDRQFKFLILGRREGGREGGWVGVSCVSLSIHRYIEGERSLLAQ
jgi:hypothetical protein